MKQDAGSSWQKFLPKWPTLWGLLKFKVYGPVPWLFMVPVLATVLEFANKYLLMSLRLPSMALLMFIGAGAYLIAHLFYLGCPAELKRVASVEEWGAIAEARRRTISEGLQHDQALRDELARQVKQHILLSMQDIAGGVAFTAAQKEAIAKRLGQAVDDATACLGDRVRELANTTSESYSFLSVKKPLLRLGCTISLAFALVPFAYQIISRLISVWHVAW